MEVLMILIVLGATTLGALCGIGGGVIIKPLFDLITDFEPAVINFLSSCVVFSMAAYSVCNSFMHKTIRIKDYLLIALCSAIGGTMGSKFFTFLSRNILSANTATAIQSLVLMLCIITVYIYTLKKENITKHDTTNIFVQGILGFTLGFVSSFLGIGGGPINIAAFTYFLNSDSKEAANISLFVIFFAQGANILTKLLDHSVPSVNPYLLLILMITGISGGIIGRALNKRSDNKQVDKIFNLANILIIFICFYNFISNLH